MSGRANVIVGVVRVVWGRRRDGADSVETEKAYTRPSSISSKAAFGRAPVSWLTT